MPVDLIVNNQAISYPSPGDEPGWGEAGTQFAIEVAEVLGNIVGPDDILQTTFAIANNQASPANVVGFSFNTGTVRGAFVNYSIYRTSTTNPSGFAEAGQMSLVYDNGAAPGSKWLLGIGNMVGNAGVNFTITDNGQLQYTSTDIGSASYSGILKFKVNTVVQQI